MAMHKILLLAWLLLHVVSCFMFFYGFLPFSYSTPKTAAAPPDLSALAPKFTHLVIVLIDALRVDFVFGDGKWKEDMPYLRNMTTKECIYSFRTRSRPPTVTMPRLKAFTSGTIPGFTDLILNAASGAFTEDNLITKLKQSGKRIVFYGDDTWIKLFPDHFVRAEGTTSFYVKDFYEVDINVTRNVHVELERLDWNVMILHYLGLDHIGHVHGPNTPLVSLKLREMDRIIKIIYDKVSERDKHVESRTLVMVCGDHGMSDGGSHGGASPPEVYTPTLFIGASKSGIVYTKETVVEQIDLAVTLSILLGTPIPTASVGRFIPTLYTLYTAAERREIQQRIACQLKQLLQNDPDIVNVCTGKIDFLEAETIIFKTTTLLQNAVGGFNLPWMVAGLFSMLLSCFGIYQSSKLLLDFKRRMFRSLATIHLRLCYDKFCIFLTFFSMLSTSFIEEEHYTWYYLTSSYFLLHLIVEIGSNASKQLGESNTNTKQAQRTLRSQNDNVKDCFCVVLLLVLLRICRSWNATGVKWLRDGGLINIIRDQARTTELYVLTVISATIQFIFHTQQEKKYTVKFLIVLAYIFLIIYRTLEFLTTDALYVAKSAQLVYGVIACLVFMSCSSNVSARTISFLSCMLLLRLDNVLWFTLIVAVERLVTRRCLFRLADEFVCEWQLVWLFFMLSKFSYFSQGNSNSLATVDISVGMVGFTYYHPVLANMITYYATHCTQLYWLASFIDMLRDDRRSCFVYAVQMITMFQVGHDIFFSSLVLVQRYHLFIWSVFAPKFMYTLSNMLLTIFMYVVIIICS